MVDLDKLGKMLDEALEAESVDSLSLWMEEQMKTDWECGIIRNAEFSILSSYTQEGRFSACQEQAFETGMTEYVAYHSSTVLSDKSVMFEMDEDSNYNLAS